MRTQQAGAMKKEQAFGRLCRSCASFCAKRPQGLVYLLRYLELRMQVACKEQQLARLAAGALIRRCGRQRPRLDQEPTTCEDPPSPVQALSFISSTARKSPEPQSNLERQATGSGWASKVHSHGFVVACSYLGTNVLLAVRSLETRPRGATFSVSLLLLSSPRRLSLAANPLLCRDRLCHLPPPLLFPLSSFTSSTPNLRCLPFSRSRRSRTR